MHKQLGWTVRTRKGESREKGQGGERFGERERDRGTFISL